MASAVQLRGDCNGKRLRDLAKRTKDAGQLRRLLALAEIYDGGSRSDAARIGGVGLQVENIWQYMRENWLSNRVFTSYDDIVSHCADAWNKLINQPWTIMSIGLRDWAHEFQL